jgi:threonine dehydrogenase-like Zn-dependent dehydrogenase
VRRGAVSALWEVIAARAVAARGGHFQCEYGLCVGSCVACKQGKTNCCMNIKVMGVHVDGGLCASRISHLSMS